MKKRTLSILLTLVMLLGLALPVNAAVTAEAAQAAADAQSGRIGAEATELSPGGYRDHFADTLEGLEKNISTFKDNNSEKRAYIRTVAEALATPVGAQGFELNTNSSAQTNIIVWLQELPTALVNALGGEAQANAAAPYMSEGRAARSSIKSSFKNKINFEYSDVFAGFGMTVNAADIERIAAMPGVYAVIPDSMMYADTGFTPDPSYSMGGMAESREALRIGELHDQGITGDGVIVGVLDTGIDYNHPDFEGVYQGGWNYITAAADHGVRPAEYLNTPMETTYKHWQTSGQPEINDRNSEYYTSHGTHVSGTIAAQAKNQDPNSTLGIAPDVDLWVARVLGPYGSGATSGIIAAIDDFADGTGAGGDDHLPKADVINLSLGANQNTAYGADIFALNNAVLAGVNVAVSAGNNAGSTMAERNPLTLGTPGTAYLPVTVAASQYGGKATYGYDSATASDGTTTEAIELLVEGYDVNSVFEDNKITGVNRLMNYDPAKGYEAYMSTYTFTGAGGVAAGDEGALYQAQLNAIPDGSLQGKILIVNRGTDFTFYVDTAMRTEAGGLIVLNRDDAFIGNMTIGGIHKDYITVFSAPVSTAAVMKELADANGSLYVQLGDVTVHDPARIPADFSSIGPVTETAGIKPDIIAPGWDILSTQPAFIMNPDHNETDYSSAYTTMSGTSMSAPHIAGILALMVQTYPNAEPAEIKARLMNTAERGFIDALEDGTPASVFEVGAGFVDPYRALVDDKDVFITVTDDVPGETLDTVIEDQTLSSLSFGAMDAGKNSRTLPVTVHVASPTSITSDSDADEVASPTSITYSVQYNNNTNYSNDAGLNGITLSVVSTGDYTFDVTAAAAADADEGLYEGYLLFDVNGNIYGLPWALHVGELTIPFSVMATAERPIVSTATDPAIRSAGGTEPLNANSTTLWFGWSGTWPTDSYGDSYLDLVLLDADTFIETYYCGGVALNGMFNDGTALYRVADFIASEAMSLETGEIETIANGAYILGIAAGDVVHGYNDIGVVFTDGEGDMAVTLEADSAALIQSEDNVTEITYEGRVYSPALALAADYGFIWTDVTDFWSYDIYFNIDQSFNVLGFDTTEDIYLDEANEPYNLYAEGKLWECDADGYFAINIPLDEEPESGDFLFTLDDNHAIVGVEGFYYNDNGPSWPMIGANKSAAITPVLDVVKNVISISINSALSMTSGETKQITVTFDPVDATNQELVWSSDNKAVATVDADGNVTAIAEGSATITVRSAEDETISASCAVTVENPSSPPAPPAPPTTPTEPSEPTEPTTPTVPTAPVESTVDEDGNAAAAVTEESIAGLLDEVNESEKDTIVISVTLPEGSNPDDIQHVELSIPADAAQAIADTAGLKVTVETPIANVTFDHKAFETIVNASDGDVTLVVNIVPTESLTEDYNLSESDLAKIGDRPVYDFTVMNGDEIVSQFQGGKATIVLPYTLAEDENPNAIVVYYIDDDGKLKTMRGKYDEETGTVEFVTTHFSVYAIAYNYVTFSDVPENHGSRSAIDFVAARGISLGVGEGLFDPGAELTRAQFLVMLMRAYDIEPENNPIDNFSDAGDDYYTGYLAAAKHLGLADGVGDNLFAPNANVKRQEMFKFLYSVLLAIGEAPETLANAKPIEEYADFESVDSWALDSTRALVESGLIKGDGVNLMPTSMSQRYQMAQILYNVLSR